MTAVVLAHQGGWDELGFALAPIAVFAVLLWLANRRAQAAERDRESVGDESD